MAIYKWSDLSRVSQQWTITTRANAWDSQLASSPFLLTAGGRYFVAVSANTTGTTAGIGAVGGTTAAGTGQIQTAPGAMVGSMDYDNGFMSSYRFQFAVTAGALPTTAATPALPAAWTGGMPAFWLDASDSL